MRTLKIFSVSIFLLFLGFSGARAQYVIGQYLNFIPSFSNPSTNPTLINVTVIDTLPSDVTYVSCSGSPCSFTPGGAVVWNVGNVSPGVSVALTVVVQITTCNTNAFLDDATFYYGVPPVAAPTPIPVSYTVACNTNTPTNTPTITFTPTYTPNCHHHQHPDSDLDAHEYLIPDQHSHAHEQFYAHFDPHGYQHLHGDDDPDDHEHLYAKPDLYPHLPHPCLARSLQPALRERRRAEDQLPAPGLAGIPLHPLGGVGEYHQPIGGPDRVGRGEKNRKGATVASGIYFYAIKNGQTVLQKRESLW